MGTAPSKVTGANVPIMTKWPIPTRSWAENGMEAAASFRGFGLPGVGLLSSGAAHRIADRMEGGTFHDGDQRPVVLASLLDDSRNNRPVAGARVGK